MGPLPSYSLPLSRVSTIPINNITVTALKFEASYTAENRVKPWRVGSRLVEQSPLMQKGSRFKPSLLVGQVQIGTSSAGDTA